MKKSILILAFLLLSLGLSAQNSALELMGGFSIEPYTIKGDAGSALGSATGGNGYLRFTYFFSEHWGTFAQFGSESVTSDESSFFGAMNKADGGKYRYRFSGWSGLSNELDVVSVGAAYRWNSGIFRFTPRVAIGLGTFDGYDYAYERQAREGSSGPEWFLFSPVGEAVYYDYLIDSRIDYYTIPTVLLLSADFQIAVRPTARFYVFAQPGITFAPTPFDVEDTKYSAAKSFEPANWAEAIAYSGRSDAWQQDPDSKVTSVEKAFASPFFHLNFGIGINFGYRNNQ